MAAKPLGRWHVASRVLAAAVPGFVLTNTASILLSFLLPGDKVSAVATATVLSYALYGAVILWIFSVERLRTIWLGLLLAIAVTAGGAWIMYTLEAAP
ncbi:MAG: iron transporter [Acidobacteriota bacterium]